VLTVDFFSNKSIQQLAEKAQTSLHREVEVGATKVCMATSKRKWCKVN